MPIMDYDDLPHPEGRTWSPDLVHTLVDALHATEGHTGINASTMTPKERAVFIRSRTRSRREEDSGA